MNNEELDSQLSAMFDDELPEQQCELLARRLARDENLKARWGRYAAISATIRKEHSVRTSLDLARKVSVAIAAEPPLVSEPAGSRKVFANPAVRRWAQPVFGAALAASVAALAILFMRAQAPLGASPAADPQLLAQDTEGTTTVLSGADTPVEAASYTVPQTVEPLAVVPSAQLANYVVAHSEVSTPLSRRNLLSAFVASEQGTAGGSSESESNDVDVEESGQDGTQNAEQTR
jgi:negative regulator of sigma E activity